VSAAADFGPPAGVRGVVRYEGELAQRGYRLTRFLVDVSHRDRRAAYLADEEGAMDRAGLSPHERDLVRRRDFGGMLHHGVNVYAIVKSGYVLGASILEIGRSMGAPATPQGGR
jgi:gallate dioxygenase